MKNTIIISAIFLLLIAGCTENNQSTGELITIDVTKTDYPKKELILQDFMDVEYIPLETNDEFLNQGIVQDIGKEIILVINLHNDGDIFVYDRHGKALRKINRQGQGGEEYVSISGIVLDEDNGEMFVDDSEKIVVYDLYGKFKRRIKYKENKKNLFEGGIYIFDYDENNLICYDQYSKNIAFALMSKQDGSITEEIKIPFKEKKFLYQVLKDEATGKEQIAYPGSSYCSIVLFKENRILLEFSSDTVYRFLPDYSLRPFLVRTPSVQSMDPEVMLLLNFMSDRYYFMETVKCVFDWNKFQGFPRTFFMYDRQEKTFSGYTVYNGDYSTKKEIYMSASTSVNHEIESWDSLDADQLVESYKKGELKGRLKEIAATLGEEDNPVIMLVKHKK